MAAPNKSETLNANLETHRGDVLPRPDPTALTTRQLNREIEGVREVVDIRFLSNEQVSGLIRALAEAEFRSLGKEVTQLREALKERLESKLENHVTRFEGMDKAIKVLQDIADKFPARIDEKIQALEGVHNERFQSFSALAVKEAESIQTQFKERDVRVEQTARDTKVAVDAALQAAEKARTSSNEAFDKSISKSESATTKQIDQLNTMINNNTAALDDKILAQAALLNLFNTDIKERLGRIEEIGIGVGKAQMTQQAVATEAKGSNQWLVGVIIGALLAIAALVVSALRG